MNWKQFKNLFKKENYDESCFVLGIDLGNDSSLVSYFNVFTETPEILDVSGGYGKPSFPTVVQWVYDTKEWVFGEYALLNQGQTKEITLKSLIERLGKKEYVDISEKSLSIVNILAFYLKELIGNVKNINPSANIVGIVVSIPSYFEEEAKEELLQAFKIAGYEKELIGLFSDRTCVFTKYFYENKPTNSRVLMLDFGSREMRSGIYDVLCEKQDVNLNCISSLFDEQLGTNFIGLEVSKLFENYYIEKTDSEKKLSQNLKKQLEIFSLSHKDLLFQKNASNKSIRLYFNFAYPPFQVNISKSEIDSFILPFEIRLENFIKMTLEKNIYKNKIYFEDIDSVLCIGGGFEMNWAKSGISRLFPDANILFYKNAKTVTAEGASILAASKLSIIEGQSFSIEDKNQLGLDYGMCVLTERKSGKLKFIPIMERNNFWWQKKQSKLILLNEKTDKDINIPIYIRDVDGEVTTINNICLDNLPIRPRGTTRLKIDMFFENYEHLKIVVKDCGFGEMFPPVNYERYFDIEVKN